MAANRAELILAPKHESNRVRAYRLIDQQASELTFESELYRTPLYLLDEGIVGDAARGIGRLGADALRGTGSLAGSAARGAGGLAGSAARGAGGLVGSAARGAGNLAAKGIGHAASGIAGGLANFGRGLVGARDSDKTGMGKVGQWVRSSPAKTAAAAAKKTAAGNLAHQRALELRFGPGAGRPAATTAPTTPTTAPPSPGTPPSGATAPPGGAPPVAPPSTPAPPVTPPSTPPTTPAPTPPSAPGRMSRAKSFVSGTVDAGKKKLSDFRDKRAAAKADAERVAAERKAGFEREAAANAAFKQGLPPPARNTGGGSNLSRAIAANNATRVGAGLLPTTPSPFPSPPKPAPSGGPELGPAPERIGPYDRPDPLGLPPDTAGTPPPQTKPKPATQAAAGGPATSLGGGNPPGVPTPVKPNPIDVAAREAAPRSPIRVTPRTNAPAGAPTETPPGGAQPAPTAPDPGAGPGSPPAERAAAAQKAAKGGVLKPRAASKTMGTKAPAEPPATPKKAKGPETMPLFPQQTEAPAGGVTTGKPIDKSEPRPYADFPSGGRPDPFNPKHQERAAATAANRAAADAATAAIPASDAATDETPAPASAGPAGGETAPATPAPTKRLDGIGRRGAIGTIKLMNKYLKKNGSLTPGQQDLLDRNTSELAADDAIIAGETKAAAGGATGGGGGGGGGAGKTKRGTERDDSHLGTYGSSEEAKAAHPNKKISTVKRDDESVDAYDDAKKAGPSGGSGKSSGVGGPPEGQLAPELGASTELRRTGRLRLLREFKLLA